jgi:hypothetical protein
VADLPHALALNLFYPFCLRICKTRLSSVTKRQLKAAGHKEKRVLTPEDLTKALKEVSRGDQQESPQTSPHLISACILLQRPNTPPALTLVQYGVHVNRPPYYVNTAAAKGKPAAK